MVSIIRDGAGEPRVLGGFPVLLPRPLRVDELARLFSHFRPTARLTAQWALGAGLLCKELYALAIATSGDYRHWVTVGDRRLSHTMDPRLGLPLLQSPASVTVITRDCMSADAWATVMMVLGESAGPVLARAREIEVIFLIREGTGIRKVTTLVS